MMVAAYNGNRWERLCAVLGHPEWATDSRFASSALRVAHRAGMQAALTAVFRTQPTAHWLERLRAADILCAKVADYGDLLNHPQLAENGMLAEIEHPRHGVLRVPGFPVNSAEAARQPYKPAPDKGEHSRELLAEMGFSEGDVADMLESGAVHAA
ncbi:Formyl-CoA:oxalate CoA-transferase [compost metagenome]